MPLTGLETGASFHIVESKMDLTQRLKNTLRPTSSRGLLRGF